MESFKKKNSPFFHISGKILNHIKETSWFTWASGFFLGALTNVYPIPSIIIFGTITIIFAVLQIYEFYKSEQIDEFNEWELALRQPDQFAASIVANTNEHYLIVGQAIEILPHPNLNSRSKIENLGWELKEVELNDLQKKFDASKILNRVGGYKEFDPPNGVKYSLIETSFLTSDSPILRLDLSRTDYFTIKSILPELIQNPSLRSEFGNLEPSKNLIPHSICLHYIVRFSDGNILCMKRDRRAAYHGNLWSFSGEEQLSEKDFQSEYPSEALFKRTLCEEVFSLREEIPLSDRWENIKNVINCMRMFSLIVEEGIFNFTIFGIYQLTIKIDEFIMLHNNFINKGIGSRDREGDFYYVPQELLESLLVKGECISKALFADSNLIIRAVHLHPTSRYRIFRLLRAIRRKPLQPKFG